MNILLCSQINKQYTTTIMADLVELNVGGKLFTTTRSTLERHEGSFFEAMLSDRWETTMDSEGRYFIDRNGETFTHVLDYLRTDEIPAGISRKMFYKELQYFNLPVDGIPTAVHCDEFTDGEAVLEYDMKVINFTSVTKYQLNRYFAQYDAVNDEDAKDFFLSLLNSAEKRDEYRALGYEVLRTESRHHVSGRALYPSYISFDYDKVTMIKKF